MPQFNVVLHGVAPQINVAILEAQLFVGQNSVARQELRLLRLVQDAQLFRHQFNLAAGNVFVDGIGVAQLHCANYGNHVFIAQLAGFFVQRGIVLLVTYNLGNSRTVAHVDEDQVPQIAAAIHPAHEHGFLAGIRSAQRAAHVGSSQIA